MISIGYKGMLKWLYDKLCLIKSYWYGWARLDLLTYVAAVFALLVLVTSAISHITAGLVLQATATNFAVELREAQVIARDHNSNINVFICTDNTNSSSSFVIQDGTQVLRKIPFPEGVTATGNVTFDQQGVPVMPTHFVLRKLGSEIRVDINSKSEVTIP